MEAEQLHPEAVPSSPVSTQPSLAALAPVPVPAPRFKLSKPHVPSACINCKKAHLACD
ncbi:hypothetical protein BGZ98_000216, partial [Dissophora globulifera]